MDYKVGYKKGVVLRLMGGITHLGCIGPGPYGAFCGIYTVYFATFARSAAFCGIYTVYFTVFARSGTFYGIYPVHFATFARSATF
ncbi:hypothetical protein [Paenibacillus sp. FSL E2-0177]|uniref:hypothetical protein n=1 Tax=unclassified Paenibacillus TaxID=185978 RepID=UPI0030ED5516